MLNEGDIRLLHDLFYGFSLASKNETALALAEFFG